MTGALCPLVWCRPRPESTGDDRAGHRRRGIRLRRRALRVHPAHQMLPRTPRSPSPSTGWSRPAGCDWATSTSAPGSWNRSRARSPCAPAATERRGIRRSAQPGLRAIAVGWQSRCPDADQRQPDRFDFYDWIRRCRRDRKGRHGGLVRRRETRRKRPHRRRPLGAVRPSSVRPATWWDVLVQHVSR